MSTSADDSQPLFLPEIESPCFVRIFYLYTLTLYRRRFRAVWIDDKQLVRSDRNTLYIGNHNSWWDALNPLLLNERVIGNRARAIMDEEQLLRHPFFRRLGVFSINRRHPRKALSSLKHAARRLNEPVRGKRAIGLWFYPEGKIVPPETPITVENGILRLVHMLDRERTRIVPFASHIHNMYGDKPELFLRMGPTIDHGLFAADDAHSRRREMARDIAGIIEALRVTVRRDSTASRNGTSGFNGFRLLLGRPYGTGIPPGSRSPLDS